MTDPTTDLTAPDALPFPGDADTGQLLSAAWHISAQLTAGPRTAAAWREVESLARWLADATAYCASDLEGGPCAACGHPTGDVDPGTPIDGKLIHVRHTTDPHSGFYGAVEDQPDGETGLDTTRCTCPAPPGYGSHAPNCGVYGD